MKNLDESRKEVIRMSVKRESDQTLMLHSSGKKRLVKLK
jgi:hypothetical protein